MAASSPSQSTAMQQQQGQLQALYNRFRDVLGGVFRERKPWGEMVDRSSFAKPANLAEATGRLRKNANYFKVNYLMVVFTVTLITLAFNPTSFIVLGLLAMAWIYLFVVRQSPIVIGGRTFSDREKALGMAIVTLIVVFFLTSVAAVLFTAIGISFVAIALHGSLRVPDDLFTDEVERRDGSFRPSGDVTNPPLRMHPEAHELPQAAPADPLAFLMAPIAAVSAAASSVVAQTRPGGTAPPPGSQPVAAAV